MPKSKYAFIGDTTYTLLLYMLYAREDMLHLTRFFVGKNLSPCFLPNKVEMPPMEPWTNATLLKYRLQCLKHRHQLRNSEIFAQDHICFAPPLIDNLKYTVLEDCPNFFSVLHSRNPKQPPFAPSLSSYWENFKFGRIYRRYGGYNPWCKNRIVTSASDKDLFNRLGLPCTMVDMEDLWRHSSDAKQKFVQKAFGLTATDQISLRKVILFSQPIIQDAHLSASELVAIYRPYIEQYGEKNILVKLHPRDDFDYKKYFPDVEILRTKAPQQLLDLLGLTFDVAITICSSAVSSMREDCKIEWIGAEVDERIVKAYGHVKSPKQY